MERKLIAKQIPSASNNYTWYNLYSDGYVEQGGRIKTTNTTIVAVSFPIPFADTPNVISNAFANGSSSGNWYGYPINGTLSTTGCSFSSLSNGDGTYWQLNGYAAESEYINKIVRREFISF